MPIRDLLEKALLRISAFSVFLMVSILSGMVACNQTLTIMLTEQLCSFAEPDEKKRAMALEDSAVIVAPLIPWSIAGAVPLASVGAPTCALLASCYLYLLPLWHLIQEKSRISKGRGNTASSYSAF